MSQKYDDSCRFCLNFVDIANRIEITDTIKKQFKRAIDIDLKTNAVYPDFHCKQCSRELETCLKIKIKFSENQKVLEKHFKSIDDDQEHEVKPELLFCNEIKDEIFDEEEFNLEPDVAFESESSKSEENEDSSEDTSESEKIIPQKKKRRKLTIKTLKRNVSEKKADNRKKRTKSPNKEKRNSVLCTDCGKSFGTDNIKRHYERVHLKLRNFHCDVCPKSFFAKIQMEQHVKIHKNIKDEECPVCKLKFHNKNSVYLHIKLKHENRYAKTCELCGKVTKTKSLLDDHIRSKHTGERKYGCPFEACDKRFYSCGDMIKHRKTFHQTNQICPICSSEVKYLSNHMRKHEMKFVCDKMEKDQQCNKRFPTRYNLTKHIDIQHRGIRKFACNFCESVFAKKPDLQNHIRTIHEQKRIKCELCSTLITRKDYYRKHVLDNHKELDDMTRELFLEKIKSTKDDDLFNYQK